MSTLSVRHPAVAGSFYPADPVELRLALVEAFAHAVRPTDDAPAPKAIVVPHAGYVYSGGVAASAYLRVVPLRSTIRRVVLIGPSHRVYLDGLAAPAADVFETPFGGIQVDGVMRRSVRHLPGVHIDDEPHRDEHSLEVQLPFVQTVLDDVTILPLAVGNATVPQVSRALEAVWNGPETLVVVSTDLSHYLPYDEANRLDARTAAAIVAGDIDAIGDRDACGARAVRGALKVANDHGLEVEQIDLRNSADTAGDRSRVVGYGAFAIR